MTGVCMACGGVYNSVFEYVWHSEHCDEPPDEAPLTIRPPSEPRQIRDLRRR